MKTNPKLKHENRGDIFRSKLYGAGALSEKSQHFAAMSCQEAAHTVGDAATWWLSTCIHVQQEPKSKHHSGAAISAIGKYKTRPTALIIMQ